MGIISDFNLFCYIGIAVCMSDSECPSMHRKACITEDLVHLPIVVNDFFGKFAVSVIFVLQ